MLLPTAADANATSPNSPVNTQRPILKGSAALGSVITAAPGTFSNEASQSDVWWECPSPGSTKCTATTNSGNTYTLDESDPAGNYIRLDETATNASGTNTVWSNVIGPITVPATPASPPSGIPGSWNLVLDSSFTGTSLNTSIWRAGWFGNGITGPVDSGESACYSPSNVSLPGDGTLHLDVTAQSATCKGVTEPFSGALISTNPSDGRSSGGFQYTYGVLQAKVYVPASGSLIADWPAVWAAGQSWPSDGEDDVMEGLGGHACFHFHNPAGAPGACDDTITPGWHTFASNWEPGSVTYYYDGNEVGSITTGITSSPMFIILDDTVNRNYPSMSGPSAFEVAYVRVWQEST